MSKILVTGSASGLGLAIVQALRSDGHTVWEYDVTSRLDVRQPNRHYIPHGLDVLINNAGINKIEWLEHLDGDAWDEVMDTNAKGIFTMAQACLPQLIATKGTILNIVSNASHMPMTCSLAYNASKAAAHMMTMQMARELTKRHNITVFGIAPNKMAGTGMSRYIERTTPGKRNWSDEYARQYQRNGLLTGDETPPTEVADLIAYLLSTKERHRYLSGCILPYGA